MGPHIIGNLDQYPCTRKAKAQQWTMRFHKRGDTRFDLAVPDPGFWV